jgi:polysaccharide export outer membrane protein
VPQTIIRTLTAAVARALVRAVSRLVSTPWSALRPSIAASGDAARKSASATLSVVLAIVLGATALAGDRLPAAAPDTGANLPTRLVGVNDLLAVTVYGAPEMSRTARVGPDGLVRLPMLHERIEARGLLPAEVEAKIAEVIQREQILVDPVVTVAIAEYGSRPVSVAGAVRHPLTFDAHTKSTLRDALARAEGLSLEAGREILVTRPAVNGEGQPPGEAGLKPLVERVSVKELLEAANPAANLILEGGEEVRVPEAGRVFVVGTVRKPGAYRLDDSGAMSVLKSLALAEGLAPFSAKEAYIYRQNDGGERQEVAVPLRKIMDRKAGDVVMGPNDILYVPDNRRGRITANALERALSFAAGTASGALIYSSSR